ncbi:putative ribosome biogenesis GTPase RsgA [Armatimonadota bacterium]|nr:putative ribosome biogenesis GTPase RsgA [Armatimonadota bacterium]
MNVPEGVGEEHVGIVLRAASGQYTVQVISEAGGAAPQYRCVLRGNLKKNFTYNTSLSVARRVTRAKRPHTKDTVAIGDRVRFVVADNGSGVIEEVLPRITRFARTVDRGMEQTLITNLDQIVIVFACAEPNPDPWRIDRWIVAAEYYEVEPLLIANKCDLVDIATFERTFHAFEGLGYRVIRTSAQANIGIDALRESLNGRISAFSGPSGVGKSSLLNQVQPGLHLNTGEIGYTTFKGRHTTTVRELIPLDLGGWVADTPGLRQLELMKMGREELITCFIEFRPFLEEFCKFRDCKHENEPGCNIKRAVEEGHISTRRYQSFLQMAHEFG